MFVWSGSGERCRRSPEIGTAGDARGGARYHCQKERLREEVRAIVMENEVVLCLKKVLINFRSVNIVQTLFRYSLSV